MAAATQVHRAASTRPATHPAEASLSLETQHVALNTRLTKVGFAAAGLVAGVVLAGTVGANAASSTPTPSPTTGSGSGSTATDPHPGDNGADGVPESQEHHGGGGRHGLDLSGTVTAVGPSSVTIKTSTATTTYKVNSNSDIDKNGEAAVSSLAVGDKVTFSVDGGTVIDKLHAGDETKNMSQRNGSSSSSSDSVNG